MPALYLTEQGSLLRCEQERLIVERGGHAVFGTPVLQVERVLVFGNVQITTPALGVLMSRGLEVAFLSARGRLKGRVVPTACKNIALRRAQYERACDEEFALDIARNLVAAKIRNGRAVLGHYGRNHDAEEGDEAEPQPHRQKARPGPQRLSAVDGPHQKARDQIETGQECREQKTPVSLRSVRRELRYLARDAGRQDTIASLLGVEGHAAKVYFGGLAAMLRQPEMTFTGRTRHPPRDPVNALLSLGYTLAGNELHGVATALGLDPWLGFLHGISERRPGLPMDLLEEFRAPLVDRFTVSLLNRRMLGAEDFVPHPKGGVTLTGPGLKHYLRAWERNLHREFQHPLTRHPVTFRRLFALQAQAMARAIEHGEPYQPFAFDKK